ncbi:MAG: response regulator [Alphaproteobacteria bacterium]
MRLLVVDDSDISRAMIGAILSRAGYENIIFANSADEAFAILDIDNNAEKSGPLVDLILLDVLMPKVNGLEACARIKANVRYRHVPVIIATTLVDEEYMAQAFTAGAIDFVTKPVSALELVCRTRNALKLKMEMDRALQRENELVLLLAEARSTGSAIGMKLPQVSIDVTTGLPNLLVLEHTVEWLCQNKLFSPLSLSFFEINDFAAYQTYQGHPAADRLSFLVATALQRQLLHLGASLFHVRAGLFAVIDRDAEWEKLQQSVPAIVDAVSTLRLPHAHATEGEIVTLSAAAVFADSGQRLQHHWLIRGAEANLEDAKKLEDKLKLVKLVDWLAVN